jgi:Fic family protein
MTTDYERIINEAAEKLERRYAEIQEQLAPLRNEEREVAEAIHRIVGSYPQGYSAGTVSRPRATTRSTGSTSATSIPEGEREAKVIEALSQNAQGLNGTEIANVLGVTAATARKWLDPMVEAGTIKREGERRATKYFAN